MFTNFQSFLQFEIINNVALHYNIELSKEEVIVAKNYLLRCEVVMIDILSVYRSLENAMFPTLKNLLQIVLTIFVSSSSFERSFNALRRLHTWLRGMMTHQRLDRLSILSIEKTIFDSVSADAIIDRFLSMKKRRQ